MLPWIEGHCAVRANVGDTSPAPHDAAGARLERPGTGGDGHAKCMCGALSDELPSANARRRWHTRHKEEVTMAPWSDAATAERYR